MITVFNGKSFGLSGERSSGFVQIDRLLVNHITSFTPSGFVVFMALVMHVDNDGYCWPSIKRLVECTGLSETTVKTALHYLTGMKINEKRLLEINARTSPNGRTTSNGYKLFPDSVEHKPDVKVTSVKQERKILQRKMTLRLSYTSSLRWLDGTYKLLSYSPLLTRNGKMRDLSYGKCIRQE